MTNQVDENDRRVRYVATAGQKVFDIDFPLDAAAELAFFKNGELVDPADYTVDLEALTAELDTGCDDGDIVALEGDKPLERISGYGLRGGLSSEQVNDDMNRFMRSLQELRRDASRSLQLNKAEGAGVSPLLPQLEEGKTIIWGAEGLANGPSVADLQDISDNLPALQSVASNISAVVAVAALGAITLLEAFGGLTAAANTIGYFTGATTMATTPFTAQARLLLDDANAADMRTTLGTVIGTDVQAYDADLAAFAGLTSAANKIGYFTGAGTMSTTDFTATARSLLDDGSVSVMRQTLGSTTVGDAVFIAASAAAARSAIGTVIGTDVQAYDAELAALASITSAANTVPVFTGSGSAAGIALSASQLFGRGDTGNIAAITLGTNLSMSGTTLNAAGGGGGGDMFKSDNLSGLANYTTARSNMGLAIGTNVQAYDATLASLSALGTAADKIAYTTGVDTWGETALSSFARTFIDDADAATVRGTLGLVIGTNVQAYDAELAALAAITSAANTAPVFTGSGTATGIALSASNLLGRGSSGNIAAITLGTGLSMSGTTMSATATGGAIDTQTFASSGTWTKPGSGTWVFVQAWGGGASGGCGSSANKAGGGGGGGYRSAWFPMSALGSTETVTVGAGGASVSGSSLAGNAGGNTTFGSWLTAYGGGAGAGNGGGGGGGGGHDAAGTSNAATTSAGAAGGGTFLAGAQVTGAVGNPGYLGGGSGGGSGTGGLAGGYSELGGGGGGGGGSNTNLNGGAGGASFMGGGGGGSAATGTGTGGAGGISKSGGNGGAGGTGSGTGAGTAGSAPGGGGGGSTSSAASGAGAAGKVVVMVF